MMKSSSFLFLSRPNVRSKEEGEGENHRRLRVPIAIEEERRFNRSYISALGQSENPLPLYRPFKGTVLLQRILFVSFFPQKGQLVKLKGEWEKRKKEFLPANAKKTLCFLRGRGKTL